MNRHFRTTAISTKISLYMYTDPLCRNDFHIKERTLVLQSYCIKENNILGQNQITHL